LVSESLHFLHGWYSLIETYYLYLLDTLVSSSYIVIRASSYTIGGVEDEFVLWALETIRVSATRCARLTYEYLVWVGVEWTTVDTAVLSLVCRIACRFDHHVGTLLHTVPIRCIRVLVRWTGIVARVRCG
jgi:hypothetical protein